MLNQEQKNNMKKCGVKQRLQRAAAKGTKR